MFITLKSNNHYRGDIFSDLLFLPLSELLKGHYVYPSFLYGPSSPVKRQFPGLEVRTFVCWDLPLSVRTKVRVYNGKPNGATGVGCGYVWGLRSEVFVYSSTCPLTVLSHVLFSLPYRLVTLLKPAPASLSSSRRPTGLQSPSSRRVR